MKSEQLNALRFLNIDKAKIDILGGQDMDLKNVKYQSKNWLYLNNKTKILSTN